MQNAPDNAFRGSDSEMKVQMNYLRAVCLVRAISKVYSDEIDENGMVVDGLDGSVDRINSGSRWWMEMVEES